MTDRRRTLACSAVLFVLCAWPLLLVDLPPYQDLPNHLATAHVLAHPDRFPDFVSNGFFKTNAALFAWVTWTSGAISAKWAARIFVAFVLAANAVAYPRMLHVLVGPRTVVSASLFLVPFVHNWFVSMGMLDFALAVALGLLLVTEMEKQRRQPSVGRASAIAVLGVATWWCHSLPLLFVHLLAAIEAAVTLRSSLAEAKRLVLVAILPLVPSTLLSLASRGGITPGPSLRTPPPWELAYELWADFFYGFTLLSVLSIVPCVVLAFYAFRAVRKQVPFFSPFAVAALFLLYALLPSGYGGWFYINARVIPFVWAALLVRVPESVPRVLRMVLALATLAHSGALGIDFVRLARDREGIAAGIPHVPERASLLPLVFDRKGSSANTRNMVQAWGPYVTERDASVPMLFATLPSYAVRYREPPPPQLTQVALEDWTIDMRSADHFCNSLRTEGVLSGDCVQTFRERWADFFALVGPRFDHLLFWGASADVRALVPSAYRIVFERGQLVIYERTP